MIFSVLGGAIGGAIGGGAIGGIGISAMFGMSGTAIGGMLGMMGGSLLGNMLFPSKHKPEDHWPELGNYPIQKSTKGPPLQKTYGTDKVAGNFTWEGDVVPYQVRHSAGGGKGGGDQPATYETRYRQSFFIDLGEGPLSVLRIWANNRQIWPEMTPVFEGGMIALQYSGPAALDITIFEGIDNQGIKDLTGEDYGEWPYNAGVFFTDYELGNSQGKPNFTFEVSSGALPFYVLCDDASGLRIVWKIGSDGQPDMNWGTDGYFKHNPGFGSISEALDCHQLPDGRLLIVHENVKVNDDGGDWYASCTMVSAAGAVDTSWGWNGYYITSKPGLGGSMIKALRILRDDAGNFYLMGQANYGSQGNFHKFDADGNRIYMHYWESNDHPITIYGAVWSLAKERIIFTGGGATVPGSGGAAKYNVCAINPSDGTIDNDWPGNVGWPGYAQVGAGSLPGANELACLPDGRFVIQHETGPADDYSMSKLLADGSALDTSWGTGGMVAAGWPFPSACWSLCAYGYNLWTLGCYQLDEVQDQTVQWVRRWDKNGKLVDSVELDSPGLNWGFHSLGLIGGRLIMVTRTTAEAANHRIEWWSHNCSYIGGVSPALFTASYGRAIRPVAPDRNVMDCNFATMCRDVLEHTRYAAGFDASLINDTTFKAVEDYCGAKGLLGSLTLKEQKDWRDWLDYFCSHFGGYYYESAGQICLGVYKDEDPVFNLSVANGDFAIADGDNPPPPIRVRDRDYSATHNQIKVAWIDRENDYDIGGPAIANDQTDIREFGSREKIYDLQGIRNAPLAARMAWQLLIDNMYRFKIYEFTVTFKNMLLEIGDVGTISDGDKIDAEKVRIYSIDEDVNGRGLAIVAFEDVSRLYPPVTFAPQPQENLRPAPTPIDIEDATISFREDIDSNRLHLAIAPGSAHFNGAYIYRSYDDVSYDWIGRMTVDGVTGGDANSIGTIQGYLPAHPAVTWAQDEFVLVSIGTVTDLPTAITANQFWNDRYVARIGSEIIAFQEAQETATAGIWRISNLRRGLFGTEPVAHYAGESFATLDPNFTYSFAAADIGQTLYFKALAFYGGNVQDIASVSSFSVTIQGYHQRPAAAACLRLASDIMAGGSGEYSGASLTLYWNLGSRTSGLGIGGHDVSPDAASWFYPDAESLLVPGGGALFGNYIQDPELQAVVLRFEQENGALIGEREISVAEQATITKATDLGGYNPARIKVIPRRALRAWDENSILVDDGS